MSNDPPSPDFELPHLDAVRPQQPPQPTPQQLPTKPLASLGGVRGPIRTPGGTTTRIPPSLAAKMAAVSVIFTL